MNSAGRKTGKLTDTHQVEVLHTGVGRAEPKLGLLRPWRIAFVLKDSGVRIVTDVTEALVLGRIAPDSSDTPVIDLRPFDAEDNGVSRKHLLIKVEGDGVYAADLQSANGTLINGRRLEPHTFYPVYHHDEIVLGLMQIVIELLIDPLG
jgi:pSer/pThr/pTyr-binding forkhead associated (FHA) protein